MSIDAGKFRHRVTLQQRSTTTNELGESVESYAGTTGLWAQVTPLTAQQKTNGGQTYLDVTHEVRIRFNVAVVYNSRLLWQNFGDLILNVESILPVDGMREEMLLLCREQK